MRFFSFSLLPCLPFQTLLKMTEEDLWFAAHAGREAEVKKILQENPALNVNWKKNENSEDWTALHSACLLGHDGIVSLLLAHPKIDVNLKRGDGATPFLVACSVGQVACVRVLLADRRVMINEPGDDAYPPLYWVAFFGFLAIVKWWIASGKVMNLGQPGDGHYDAVEVAERSKKPGVAALLRDVRYRPEETRRRIKAELSV